MNLSPCTDPTPLVHLGFAESPSSLANPNSSRAVPGTVGNPHAGSEGHSPSFPRSSALPALRNLLPRVLSTTVSAEGWEASSSFHPFCISLLFRAQVGPGSCGHVYTSREDFILLLSHRVCLDLYM